MLETLLLLTLAAPQQPFSFQDLPGNRVELRENNAPVYVYNIGPQLPAGVPEDRRRCCYVHPVVTPAGVTITDDFPKDHYHHRGLFWGWGVVESGGKTYDIWMLKGGIEPRFEKLIEKTVSSERAVLTVENGWYADGNRIVGERTSIAAYPARDGARELDFAVTLTATGGPVTLKPIRDAGKSYGGLNARFAPRESTVIRTSDGPISMDEDLNRHAWAEFEAVYNGKRAVMRITPDPANPLGPPQWCLRNYGFLGAAFPGKTEQVASWTLEPGKPLTLKYRIRVADLP